VSVAVLKTVVERQIYSTGLG